MSVVIRYIAEAVTIGLFFWVLFVVLIFWAAVIRAIEWLADSNTENLVRLTVKAGSLANTAWSRSGLGERLAAFRTATQLSDQKPGLPPERLYVAHAVRQFAAGHGLFRS